MITPVFSACAKAFSGQAFTHWASLQDRQARAKLKRGIIRITRIRAPTGFPRVSPFSTAQVYSQIPQPVHLPGSTETNFLDSNFADGIAVFRSFGSI